MTLGKNKDFLTSHVSVSLPFSFPFIIIYIYLFYSLVDLEDKFLYVLGAMEETC